MIMCIIVNVIVSIVSIVITITIITVIIIIVIISSCIFHLNLIKLMSNSKNIQSFQFLIPYIFISLIKYKLF